MELSFINKETSFVYLQKMLIHSRILFGLLFIFSGLMKFYNLSDFQTAIKSFELVPIDYIETFSYLIPIVELWLGLFIICSRYSIIISIVIITSFLLGLKALSYKPSVLQESVALCCDGGNYENVQPFLPARCNSAATAYVNSDCDEEANITCRLCVDYTVSNCLCLGEGSDFCMENDGSFYYGQLVNCPAR